MHIFPKHLQLSICALLCASLFACDLDKEVGVGNAQQASAALASRSAGFREISAVHRALHTRLESFSSAPPISFLNATSPAWLRPFPYTKITQTQLSPLYGKYTETSAGQFEHTLEGGAISVQFMNGVDLLIDSIRYDLNDNLRSMRMEFSSHNRGVTTPDRYVIDGEMTELRFDHLDEIPTLDAYTYTRISDLGIGYVDDSGVYVRRTFEFTDSVTMLQIAANVAIEKYYTGKAAALPVNGDFWQHTTAFRFLPSDVAGMYVATDIRRIYNDSVQGNKVAYTAHLALLGYLDSSPIPIVTDGVVNYFPAADSGVEYSIDGTIYRVAAFAGGPHTCDLAVAYDSFNPYGTGEPITMNWVNAEQDPMMPTYFACHESAITSP